MPVSAEAAVRTVIVADDTAFVRDRFRAALHAAGHRVRAAADASELLAQVRSDSRSVDLVVLDLRLPHVQGVALVRALRRVEGFTAPIVVFSGTIAHADEVRELAGLGVTGYVNEYSAVQHILPALAPHLFPNQYNRRSHPRAVLGTSVAYRLGNTIAAAVTLNISHGGLAIRTTSPLSPDTVVRVRYRLPGDRREIDADAQVRWAEHRVGMGLQFTRIDAADQTAIDEFVRAHFFSNRRA